MSVFSNFVCLVLFPICFGIDFASGDAFELKPNPVTITLAPIEAPPVSVAPPAAPPGQESSRAPATPSHAQ